MLIRLCTIYFSAPPAGCLAHHTRRPSHLEATTHRHAAPETLAAPDCGMLRAMTPDRLKARRHRCPLGTPVRGSAIVEGMFCFPHP